MLWFSWSEKNRHVDEIRWIEMNCLSASVGFFGFFSHHFSMSRWFYVGMWKGLNSIAYSDHLQRILFYSFVFILTMIWIDLIIQTELLPVHVHFLLYWLWVTDDWPWSAWDWDSTDWDNCLTLLWTQPPPWGHDIDSEDALSCMWTDVLKRWNAIEQKHTLMCLTTLTSRLLTHTYASLRVSIFLLIV